VVTELSPWAGRLVSSSAERDLSLWRLEKYEALGNDFLVVVVEESNSAGLGREPEFFAGWAQSLCDRHRGVGADGLLALWVGSDKSSDKRRAGLDPQQAAQHPGISSELSPVVAMTLWNADGTLAETSGNGLRVSAHAVTRSALVTKAPFVILTRAGLRTVRFVEVVSASEALVSVDMGTPVVQALDSGLAAALSTLVPWSAVFVDVGNPHLVFFAQDPVRLASIDLVALAQQVYCVLGREVNLEVATRYQALGLDENNSGSEENKETASQGRFSIRVHERGVGETEACGSGSVAVAKALGSLGLANGSVEVVSAGGSLSVDWEGERAWLTGPSRWIANLEVTGPRP
jgi:diaminopimelate epimerase